MTRLMTRYDGWSREEKERYLLLKREQRRRDQQARRERIQAAKRLTPEIIADFAYLHILDDDTGDPISPAAHHWLWLRLICNTHIRKLLIIAPPESAKTTWIIQAWLGCSIGFQPEWPRIITAVSGPTAEKRSLALRAMVTSSQWRTTFPGIEKAAGMKWETTEWSLAPGGKPRKGRIHPTIFACGQGGSITGARAREAVADDLLDFDNTRTAHQRGLVDHWTHNSFLSRALARVGRVVMIGTMWHHDDVYARIRRAGDWVICHVPLLSDGGDVYANIWYPDNYSGERLGEPVGRAEIE
jgi:hypothetical protein